MRPGELSAEKRERIAELADLGFSRKAIMRAVGPGVSLGCVSHHLVTLGIGNRLPHPQPRITRPIMRGGRPVYRFTEEEDALLIKMSLDGVKYRTMAREMNKRWPHRPRSTSTVRYRLLTIARNEEHYELAA